MRRLFLVTLLAGACVKDTRTSTDRGASGFFEHVAHVEAPPKVRCTAHKGTNLRTCNEAKATAEVYVRRLAADDDVCLENGFGEPPGAKCDVRAKVVDVAPDRVLLEVRRASPSSKWFQKELHQVWYDEGALVDLYLAERGY